MDTTPRSTRIWWDNEEVHFIGWSDKSLVFHWDDPRETAVHMPRGVVMRLLDKGVLRIEGYVPVWMQPAGHSPTPSPVESSSPAPANSRLNIVLRLIRKLGGERNRGPARAAGT